mmetsp:Transcript_17421/g.31268  ORF Transcript_17421/g.31268 Transcript_17421/m.31268 type:complete len:286 (+) Transcript_17421:5-862(+)
MCVCVNVCACACACFRYFHVEARGNVVMQGMISPFIQAIGKYSVDESDKSIHLYKDAIADVINHKFDYVQNGSYRVFERKGICKLPTLKVDINNIQPDPTKTDKDVDDDMDVNLKPRSITVAICVAARPDFDVTQQFVRELRAGVLIAVPWKELTMMELGFLRQNELVQKRLSAVFAKLVRKHGKDKLEETRKQVQEVKKVMQKNIQAALTRGENLNEVCQQTEQLEHEATRFKRSAVTVNRTQRCKYCRAWCCAAICFIIVAAVIAVPIVVVCTDTHIRRPNGL